MAATREEAWHRAFRHEALLYSGHEGFLAGTAPFVREGVAAGEPVLVALPAARLEALRAELDADAEAVSSVDMVELGSNPARIIPVWHDFLSRNGGGRRPVRGIGEPIWAGRSEACPRLDEMAQSFDAPLPEPPAEVSALTFGEGDAREVRRFVAGKARMPPAAVVCGWRTSCVSWCRSVPAAHGNAVRLHMRRV